MYLGEPCGVAEAGCAPQARVAELSWELTHAKTLARDDAMTISKLASQVREYDRGQQEAVARRDLARAMTRSLLNFFCGSALSKQYAKRLKRGGRHCAASWPTLTPTPTPTPQLLSYISDEERGARATASSIEKRYETLCREQEQV